MGPTCDGVGPSPVSVAVESSSSSSAAGSSSVDKERESWALIDSLSWDDILSRCPHTVVGIKDHLKALWQQAVRVPLRALSSDISDESAWKLLFLLPSMLLMKDVQQGGKKGGGEIKRKFRRFWTFSGPPSCQYSLHLSFTLRALSYHLTVLDVGSFGKLGITSVRATSPVLPVCLPALGSPPTLQTPWRV